MVRNARNWIRADKPLASQKWQPRRPGVRSDPRPVRFLGPVRVGASDGRTKRPVSASGEADRLSSGPGRVRLPHGVLVGVEIQVVNAPGSALGLQNRRLDLRGSIPPPPAAFDLAACRSEALQGRSKVRSRSSAGRAAACRAEGCGFDSRVDRCPKGRLASRPVAAKRCFTAAPRRKCVRRWLGACLLSRCTWVRFPPLPLVARTAGCASRGSRASVV